MYPNNTNLALRLSVKTKDWLLQNIGNRVSSFEELKEQFPNFTDALRHYGISLEQWHSDVCDPLSLDMEKLIGKDPNLANFLQSLSGNKHVVTLSSKAFTEKLLAILSVEDKFDSMVNLTTGAKGPAYADIHRISELPKESVAVFGDNNSIDLEPARELGFQTFLVDPSIPISEQYK